MAAVMEILREDHVNMGRVLDILERQLVIFERAGEPDYDLIKSIVEYCLDYPNLNHHPLEDLICLHLRENGQRSAEIADKLVEEHRILAELTRRFAVAVDHVLKNLEVPRGTFSEVVREFIDTYRTHMAMEDKLFFPAALQTLSAPAWAAIEARADAHRDPLQSRQAEARFKALRREIEALHALAAQP